MASQTQKILLIIAGMAIAFGIFLAVIEVGQKIVTGGDSLLDQPHGVEISKGVARINFNGTIISFPAPDQYCFLDNDLPVDKAALTAMTNMQRTYSNHLWLVVANCEQLKDVREKNDLSTYIDTGMIVTPASALNIEAPADRFVESATETIKKLNPVEFETLLNKNLKENLSETLQVKSGQPVIYGSNSSALFFSITHDMSTDIDDESFKLTEFDVITTIKDRPVMLIFTYKNLEDMSERQKFTESYLETVRLAN
jgi:hypothetical protein